MNKHILIGRIVGGAQTKTFQGKNCVMVRTSFQIAVPRPPKYQESDWFTVYWSHPKGAPLLHLPHAREIQEQDEVYIEGVHQRRRWDAAGKWVHEVNVSRGHVRLLSTRAERALAKKEAANAG